MLGKHKPTLTYSLHHLPRRDAALFESFVRIINSRTRHHWQLHPQPDVPVGEADLPVFYDTPSGLQLLDISRPCLLIGKDPREIIGDNCLYVALPLRSDLLEECLNHLGQYLLDSAAPESESQFPDTEIERTLQLRRWPPHELLVSKTQLRLATLLTGPPITLEMLCTISGQSWEACLAFIELLEEHSLLADDGASFPARPAPQPPPNTRRRNAGLLARIRRSLGLKPPRTPHGI